MVLTPRSRPALRARFFGQSRSRGDGGSMKRIRLEIGRQALQLDVLLLELLDPSDLGHAHAGKLPLPPIEGRHRVYRDIDAKRLPPPIRLGGRNYWLGGGDRRRSPAPGRAAQLERALMAEMYTGAALLDLLALELVAAITMRPCRRRSGWAVPRVAPRRGPRGRRARRGRRTPVTAAHVGREVRHEHPRGQLGHRSGRLRDTEARASRAGSRAPARRRVCSPSVRTLASDTGLSEHCVQYRLRELETAGLISSHHAQAGQHLHLEPGLRSAGLASVVGVPGGAGNGRQ